MYTTSLEKEGSMFGLGHPDKAATPKGIVTFCCLPGPPPPASPPYQGPYPPIMPRPGDCRVLG